MPNGSDIVFDSDIAFAVICLRRDICPLGKLRIYLYFGYKPKYNFGVSQNITLTKSKYNFDKVKI